jgi:hypothetical protein
MTDLAEQFGGIAVAIMMEKTQLEIENDAMSKILNEMSDGPLKKLTTGELRKSADWRAELDATLAEVKKLSAMLAEANAIAERQRAAMPAFKAWALGTPTVDYGNFRLAEKRTTVDDHGRRSELTFSKFVMPEQSRSWIPARTSAPSPCCAILHAGRI